MAEFTFDDLYGEKAGPKMDPTPMAIPAGFKRPPTLAEQVQRLVRGALSQAAAEKGLETFEEANDFDIPDDPVDPSTPFEEFFDPTLGRSLTPHEMAKFGDAYRAEYLKAQGKALAEDDRRAAIAAHIEELRKQRKPGAGGGSPPAPPPTPDNAPKAP